MRVGTYGHSGTRHAAAHEPTHPSFPVLCCCCRCLPPPPPLLLPLLLAACRCCGPAAWRCRGRGWHNCDMARDHRAGPRTPCAERGCASRRGLAVRGHAARARPVVVAVGETVILLPPPSPFSRCINSDGERASAEWLSRQWLQVVGCHAVLRGLGRTARHAGRAHAADPGRASLPAAPTPPRNRSCRSRLLPATPTPRNRLAVAPL